MVSPGAQRIDVGTVSTLRAVAGEVVGLIWNSHDQEFVCAWGMQRSKGARFDGLATLHWATMLPCVVAITIENRHPDTVWNDNKLQVGKMTPSASSHKSDVNIFLIDTLPWSIYGTESSLSSSKAKKQTM